MAKESINSRKILGKRYSSNEKGLSEAKTASPHHVVKINIMFKSHHPHHHHHQPNILSVNRVWVRKDDRHSIPSSFQREDQRNAVKFTLTRKEPCIKKIQSDMKASRVKLPAQITEFENPFKNGSCRVDLSGCSHVKKRQN